MADIENRTEMTSSLPRRLEGRQRRDTQRACSVALERRVEMLERSRRRFAATAAACGLVLVAAITTGAASAVPAVLSAKTFQLVDGDGRVRASWVATGDHGVQLVIRDTAGRSAAALELSSVDPYLSLSAAGREADAERMRQLYSWSEPVGGERRSGRTGRPLAGSGGAEEDDGAFDWDRN
jgi:hypothetical protein